MINWFSKSNATRRSAAATQSRANLLQRINADVPAGIDWLQGALQYVPAEYAKHDREIYRRYILSKPFSPVHRQTVDAPFGAGGGPQLLENCSYLANFLNMLATTDLPGGSRVLDVACGSGWVAQFFSRMGYRAYGFDISRDMVDLSKQRFIDDSLLAELVPVLEERLFVLDIEREKLPAHLNDTFDAIVLESCLHHFIDPITALENLCAGLAENGIVIIIEGENRIGPLKAEYINVMKEFATLERPYAREELEGMLDLVGLTQREFLGRVNGWFSPSDPRVSALSGNVKVDADALNFVIASRSEAAMRRIFPFR